MSSMPTITRDDAPNHCSSVLTTTTFTYGCEPAADAKTFTPQSGKRRRTKEQKRTESHSACEDDETEDARGEQRGTYLLCSECGQMEFFWVYRVGSARGAFFGSCSACDRFIHVPKVMHARLRASGYQWPVRKKPPRSGKKKTEKVPLKHYSSEPQVTAKRARRR